MNFIYINGLKEHYRRMQFNQIVRKYHEKHVISKSTSLRCGVAMHFRVNTVCQDNVAAFSCCCKVLQYQQTIQVNTSLQTYGITFIKMLFFHVECLKCSACAKKLTQVQLA